MKLPTNIYTKSRNQNDHFQFNEIQVYKANLISICSAFTFTLSH